MAHDQAVASQKTGKTTSPPKDQPAPYPYPDWSAMQAYYGPGVLPPAYFTQGIAPGHAPTPYMWGPQPLMPPPYGTPYAAMYPHVGAYPHPLVPMMANPLSMEPAKSANSKEKSSNKKLKEVEGTTVSVGSGNSKKTMSSSEDYSAEGSSDVNDPKEIKIPRKRSSKDGPDAETNAAAKMEDVLTPNHMLGNTAILPNHCFPPVIKPAATNVANSRAIGTPKSLTPGVMMSSHSVGAEISIKDERELKREKRKQSNRESARRSRLRKQAETEVLATQVESLIAENTSLRSEISRLTESSEKLRSENSALMGKLKDTAAPSNAEVTVNKTAASPPPQAVENFLSMIDNTNKSGISSRHTDHSEPKLHQLLGSTPTTDVVAAS